MKCRILFLKRVNTCILFKHSDGFTMVFVHYMFFNMGQVKLSLDNVKLSFCLYKGKGDALDRGNYRGLKLTEQAMKILERIVNCLIRQVVSIDNSQFGFVPGRGTTDAIFVVRQLQEKNLAVNKRLYMAFRGPIESI